MKRLNYIKNNMLGFIIGGIIFGSIGITVASQILATQVSYTNEKSIANVTSVDGALTELYGLAEECQNASSSGSSVTYYGKDAIAVYLDPTGNATNCSSENFTSDTEIKEGCMRFYVYAEDNEYKYAILDHNTTAKVSSGFYVAQSQVKQDTSNWNPNYQAQNISAYEIYKITESTNKKSNWQIKNGNNFPFTSNLNGTDGNGQGYGWLFDRAFNCTSYGCTTGDSTTQGYWTCDMKSYSDAWYVSYDGKLYGRSFNLKHYGIRPVIKISK